MAEYGLIVVKNSYTGHVEDANSSELAIDTRLLVPKIHDQGSGSITSKTSGTMASATIAHGLSYAPDVEVFIGDGANRAIIGGNRVNDYPFIVSVTTTQIQILQTDYDAFATLYNYYYYIFKEEGA